MRKPGFGVITAVICILVGVAFVSHIFSEFIPSEAENKLAFETSPFLVQAGHQLIDWRLPTDETFREARRLDRPIMLVVGTACSLSGRIMDSQIFSAPEVRSAIATNFIPIRIDSMENPEMASAFLPIARGYLNGGTRLAIPPDFQIWLLSPEGELISFAAQLPANKGVDVRSFLAQLNFAINLNGSAKDRLKAGSAQRGDLAAIRSPLPPSPLDSSAFLGSLDSLEDPHNGGYPVSGIQRLWPNIWRLQILKHQPGTLGRSISPLLHSPTVDILDGGFFTASSSLDWTAVQYDKYAVENAAMLDMLALGACTQSNAQYRWLAERTFDFLAGEMYQNGSITAGRVGDETKIWRSNRSSFSPKSLRALADDSVIRERIRDVFGLRVETNSQMTPRLIDLNYPLAYPEEFYKLVDLLKKGRAEAKYTGLSELDVTGYCLARMMHSARILGDSARMEKAKEIFAGVKSFRTGDDVVHSIGAKQGPYAYLGDYLAYADASLEYFLSTGDRSSFESGLAVLKRGLFLFKGPVSGEYDLRQSTRGQIGIQDIDAPEICDSFRESCSAQIVRLTNAYGRLLGAKGNELQRISGDVLSRFSTVAMGLGPYAASFYCAFENYSQRFTVIVVGPNSLQDALALATSAPTTLISPVSGNVRAPATEPGIYLVSESGNEGPLTAAKAISNLSLN